MKHDNNGVSYRSSRLVPGSYRDWGGVEVCSVQKTPGGPLPKPKGVSDVQGIPMTFTLKVCVDCQHVYVKHLL